MSQAQADATHGKHLCAMAITMDTCSYEEIFSVIWMLWAKHISPIETPCQLTQVYSDGVLSATCQKRVQSLKLVRHP